PVVAQRHRRLVKARRLAVLDDELTRAGQLVDGRPRLVHATLDTRRTEPYHGVGVRTQQPCPQPLPAVADDGAGDAAPRDERSAPGRRRHLMPERADLREQPEVVRRVGDGLVLLVLVSTDEPGHRVGDGEILLIRRYSLDAVEQVVPLRSSKPS